MRRRGGEVLVPAVGADGGVVDAGICAQKKIRQALALAKVSASVIASARQFLEGRAAKLQRNDGEGLCLQGFDPVGGPPHVAS